MILVSRIIDVAGVAVLHSAWQSTAVALSTFLLLRSIPQAKTRLRYAIGLVALSAMATLPVLLTMRPAPLLPMASIPRVLSLTPVPLPEGRTSVQVGNPVESEPAMSHVTPASLTSPPAAPIRILVSALGVLWIVGVTLRLGSLARATYRVRRTIAQAAPVACPRALRVLHHACDAVGIGRDRIRLRSTRNDAGPALVGMLRPTIVVPETLLTALPDEALRAVFVHELAHFKRADLVVNPVLQLVDTALFHHPLARRLVAMVERERERCCDDAVIAAGVPPDRYVATLVELATATSHPPRLSVSATAGGELLHRAERLLAPRQSASSPWRTATQRSVALITCWAAMAVVVPVSIVRDPQGSQTLALQLSAIADTASREHWIAFSVPLTTVPLSDAERPHSGWNAMVEIGALAQPFRMASVSDERLVVALRLAAASNGSTVRVTRAAFRTAIDAASVLPASVPYLGQFTNISSTAAIARLINAAPATVRGELVGLLALHNDAASGPLLASALTRDPAASVRAESARWLQYRPAAESEPLLRLALRDPHQDVRDEAAGTLRRIAEGGQ